MSGGDHTLAFASGPYGTSALATASATSSALAGSGTIDIRSVAYEVEPVRMILTCPSCCERHIDRGEFATKPHHTHACQHCGMVWRPAIEPTVGVQFLPGFKDDQE